MTLSDALTHVRPPYQHREDRDNVAARLLRWDGRALTEEGNDRFAVYVWTHAALATALIYLATERAEADAGDVAALARMTEVLAGRDLRTPFVVGATAIIGALLHLRLHALEATR